MLVFVKPGSDFSSGCEGRRISYLLFATHPHLGIRELIPFRFVDSIMKAWQRYSTRR
jgi:hypothetical protein